VITPRRTRLIRVPDLHTFRHVIVNLAVAGNDDRRASRVVLVPTAGAARQLARAIGERQGPPLSTRDELYDRLHARMGAPPARLDQYERIVLIQSAARDAVSVTSPVETGAAWRLRPGLVAEVLRFYDQLRRQARTVGRFEELVVEALLTDAEHDRGAERMLAQARWLAATFRAYERRVSRSGACDEHLLREQLVSNGLAEPIREIVVTLGDWIGDPHGLFLADFDLLTRLPGLEAIDVVATTTSLASGFHQRVHDWLPGIEEVEADSIEAGLPRATRPALAAPASDPEKGYFVYRDREEELIAVARRLTEEVAAGVSLDHTAVVFKRPLPYLYLAREVFGTARLPYQAFDALPLAAEPFAAALDLVFEFVESDFTRSTLVALLKSPHFEFRYDGQPLTMRSIDALDRALSGMQYLGTYYALMAVDSDEKLGDGWAALHAGRAAAEALAPMQTAALASSQFRRLIDFIDAHEVVLTDADPLAPRLRLQRAAVRDALVALGAAHERHDDVPMSIGEMATSARLWIEAQTFVAESQGAGLQLVDDEAARYGQFDDVTLVGLVEGEWPERPIRNIFFPPFLLSSLGWPTEKDRRGAAVARFIELLQSPRRRVAISTVTLDEDALVEPSRLVDEIPAARLTAMAVAPLPGVTDSDGENVLDTGNEWLALRSSRSSGDASMFHGQTGPLPSKAWSISALETYLDCPFKFFAKHVMQLEEEPDDEEVMDPRRRGQFVHEVFEAFFDRWQRNGHQAITPSTIDKARVVFREVVETLIGQWRLSSTEAALERTRLLGSPAAAGLGEAVLRMEAERPVPVVARLLEHRLTGEFTFATAGGSRRLAIKGKADRIDLLDDGTFRLIDYKLGWPPNRARALQLPIYALCAEQTLDRYRGRRWTLGEAAYLAFKGPRRVVSLFPADAERGRVLDEAQERLVDTVDAIGAGRFPPAPDDVYRCETCSYSAVCRKDYVGDV